MSWPEVEFESLFLIPSRNGVYKSKDHHGSGVPIVNMGELFAFNRIGNQPMSLIQMSDSEMDKSGLIDGDLLFGRRSLVEEGAGKCSMVYKPTGSLTFESSIIRVRLDRSVADPEFFFNYFRSPIGRSRVKAIVGGAAVKGIRGSDLKLIKVHLPQIDEQIAIRNIVAVYDDLIATNQRRIALLEEAARRMYREWFVSLRFPGHETVQVTDGVPEGWSRLSLADVAEITMGQSPESRHYNTDGDGLPFHQGVSDFGHRFVTHETYTKQATRTAEAADILCSVRAPVGRLNLTRDKIAIGRGLSAMHSRAGHQSLLFYQLDALFVEEDMIGGGAIFASVGKKELFGQQILQPSANIAATFNRLAADLDAQIENLDSQNRALAKACDLLLPKLMSGQLDVSGIQLPDEVVA
ncbi:MULTISPECIES: restriction endonuclease subunit S [Aeromonas]|uniref:restriction endonuclease subunit S n=2 Tax=Aeromonadaceae TaxID=84642 RepID=UPI001B31AE33|nr:MULTISPECIES: restriction endonuclease subunit S [Aeromonas]MBP4079567.1 restriction endonuclease subunit S [Aeromonas sp. MrichA-1]MCU7793762.1 restriction endonuclease subunit S [Aeromonas caviae]